MSHEFDPNQGFLMNKPSWHRQEVAVLKDWPGSWVAACEAAKLTWDVEAVPLTMPVIYTDGALRPAHVNGWQGVARNDMPLYRVNDVGMVEASSDALLTVQQSSYKIITNEAFGAVIEHIIGKVGDDWAYEALFSLSGGRQVICLLRARTPLNIGPDPSRNFTYIVFNSRHDGQGGLRGIPTNVRVQCANTRNMAENQSRQDRVGFTIKHTSTWTERIDAAANVIHSAVKEGKAWEAIATRLGMRRLVPAQRDRMLLQVFKTDSSMTPRMIRSIEDNRDSVRQILQSPTCEGIGETMLGFVNAVDEWADHIRPARSEETKISRSLLRAEPIKVRALSLVRAASDR